MSPIFVKTMQYAWKRKTKPNASVNQGGKAAFVKSQHDYVTWSFVTMVVLVRNYRIAMQRNVFVVSDGMANIVKRSLKFQNVQKFVFVFMKCVKLAPRSSPHREICGLNLGPVKSDSGLPTALHHCDISSKVAVLPPSQ